MEIRNLSKNELDEYIETYRDRIETMSEYISETEDYATRSAMQDELVKYKMTLSTLLQETEIRSALVNLNPSIDLNNFKFESSDHLRFENKVHVSGPHGGAKRIITIEKSNSGLSSLAVTLYNADEDQPTVQMAPKTMKIIESDENKIVLRGYGHDMMGNSFADYGMTILLENGIVQKCCLHMLDRKVDVEYFKHSPSTKEESTISQIILDSKQAFKNGDGQKGKFLGKKVIEFFLQNIDYVNQLSNKNLSLDTIEELLFLTIIPEQFALFYTGDSLDSLRFNGLLNDSEKNHILLTIYIELYYRKIHTSNATIDQRRIRVMKVYQIFIKEFIIKNVLPRMGDNTIFKSESKDKLANIFFGLLTNFLTYHTNDEEEIQFNHQYGSYLILPLKGNERMYNRREELTEYFYSCLIEYFKVK